MSKTLNTLKINYSLIYKKQREKKQTVKEDNFIERFNRSACARFDRLLDNRSSLTILWKKCIQRERRVRSMILFDGSPGLSFSLSLSFFVHRRSLKFRGVEHEKMREKDEREGEYYRLAGWKRSVARSHATSNLWCKRFWWVSLDPVAHHTLVVAPEFLDKSPSTMAHQGIRLVRWRGTYLGENRLGISNTWPKFSYPLSMLCGYFRHRLSRCLGTIKIIYSTLFQGYRHLHPREWFG